MSEMRDEMLRTLDRVVEATLTTAERENADNGGHSASLWSALVEQGMTELGEAESEITFADAMALVARAAYHATPVPMAETIMARRLLSRAGMALPAGPVTLAIQSAGMQPGRFASSVAGVAYGGVARHFVLATGDALALFERTGPPLSRNANQAGEPRDTLDLSKAGIIDQKSLQGADRQVLLEGALLRSVQISGALERTLGHCLTWVNERVQFGKPIARFQAIQHAMAIMASEVAAARTAVDMAVEASEQHADWASVAIAKSRSGEAAGKVAAAAHAAFGAMGFTREHQLHYSTRRLWAWRDDFGSEVVWQAELGRHFAALGGENLWRELTRNG